jgi:hypothetical protein
MVHSFNQWMQQVHPGETPALHHADEFLLIDQNPYMPPPYRPYATVCPLEFSKKEAT